MIEPLHVPTLDEYARLSSRVRIKLAARLRAAEARLDAPARFPDDMTAEEAFDEAVRIAATLAVDPPNVTAARRRALREALRGDA